MVAAVFSGLADPTRVRIVEILAERGELPAGTIAEGFPMTRAAVSRHLRHLEDAGFVIVREEAQRRMYRLDPRRFIELDGWLDRYARFWDTKMDSLRRHVEGKR